MSSIDIGGLADWWVVRDHPGHAACLDAGAVTSDHTGGNLDFTRTAIMSLQHFAEITSDEALGMTPSLQHVRRSRQGY
jgi:hypothetical protein